MTTPKLDEGAEVAGRKMLALARRTFVELCVGSEELDALMYPAKEERLRQLEDEWRKLLLETGSNYDIACALEAAAIIDRQDPATGNWHFIIALGMTRRVYLRSNQLGNALNIFKYLHSSYRPKAERLEQALLDFLLATLFSYEYREQATANRLLQRAERILMGQSPQDERSWKETFLICLTYQFSAECFLRRSDYAQAAQLYLRLRDIAPLPTLLRFAGLMSLFRD